MRSYAVIGCGAIGGYYGACLQRAGHAVHFLLHRDFAHVRRFGLTIESKAGNFRLDRVQAYQRPEDIPACDCVMIALKATENVLLGDILAAVRRNDTGAILLMQNGLNQEARIAAWIGSTPLVSGLCFVCSVKTGPGHIRHLDYGDVTLAEYRPDRTPAGTTAWMRRIGADFQRAGIPVRFARDVWSARWRKLMWNIPFSGLTALLHANTQELLACPVTASLVRDIMREVMRGARACGASIPSGFDRRLMRNTQRMVPYLPSLALDRQRGRPMEVEAIFGEPWRAAQRAGEDLPLLGLLYRTLSFVDTQIRMGLQEPSRVVSKRTGGLPPFRVSTLTTIRAKKARPGSRVQR